MNYDRVDLLMQGSIRPSMKILQIKGTLMSSVTDPGCLSRIPNTDMVKKAPDPGSMVKKAPDPGSGSAAQFMRVDIFFQRSKARRQLSPYLTKLLFKLKNVQNILLLIPSQ
jgi:hypothetical protein